MVRCQKLKWRHCYHADSCWTWYKPLIFCFWYRCTFSKLEFRPSCRTFLFYKKWPKFHVLINLLPLSPTPLAPSSSGSLDLEAFEARLARARKVSLLDGLSRLNPPPEPLFAVLLGGSERFSKICVLWYKHAEQEVRETYDVEKAWVSLCWRRLNFSYSNEN